MAVSDGIRGNHPGICGLHVCSEQWTIIPHPGNPGIIRSLKTKRSSLYREDHIKNKSPYIGGPLQFTGLNMVFGFRGLILVLLRVIYFRVNRNMNAAKNINPDIVHFLIFVLSVSNGSSMNDTKDKIPIIAMLMSRNRSFIMI